MELGSALIAGFRRFGLGWTFDITKTGYLNMKIIVTRTSKSVDGIFGTLTIDCDPFTCVTEERLDMAIPPGTYKVEFTQSPEFKREMPLIDVPGRTAIRIHPANYPRQLKGCIAVGEKKDGDAIDNSDAEFEPLFKIIKKADDLSIEVKEAYNA